MSSARASVPISAFPEELQDMLRNEIDMDHSGGIGESDLKGMIAAYKKQKQKVSFLKWIIVGGGFALILMSAATFAVSLAAAELAKDSTPNENGVPMVKSSGQPVRTAQFGISSGIVRVHEGRRLHSDHSDGDSVHAVDIARARVMEACGLFKQGAASEVNLQIDGATQQGIHHISVTSFSDGCEAANGILGVGDWSLECPDGSDVCHGFTTNLEQGIGNHRLGGAGRRLVCSVICTHMRKMGKLTQSEWESSQAAGSNMPAVMHQGYRYWADVIMEDLNTVDDNTKIQTEMVMEFFVTPYTRQLGWFEQRSWGEFSLIGMGVMLVGYPLCFILGSLNVALPSLMLHLKNGTAHTIHYVCALIYHTSQMKGAFIFTVLMVGMYSCKTRYLSKVKRS